MLRWYILARWARLTVRRYGVNALVTGKRVRHAACGRGTRALMWARAHGSATGYQLSVRDVLERLERERLA